VLTTGEPLERGSTFPLLWPLLLFQAVCVSLAYAFESGSLEAWVVDGERDLGVVTPPDATLAAGETWSTLGLLLGFGIGLLGWVLLLYTGEPDLQHAGFFVPWGLMVAAAAVPLVWSWSLGETGHLAQPTGPEARRGEERTIAEQVGKLWADVTGQVRTSLRFIARDGSFLALLVAFAVLVLLIQVLANFLQIRAGDELHSLDVWGLVGLSQPILEDWKDLARKLEWAFGVTLLYRFCQILAPWLSKRLAERYLDTPGLTTGERTRRRSRFVWAGVAAIFASTAVLWAWEHLGPENRYASWAGAAVLFGCFGLVGFSIRFVKPFYGGEFNSRIPGRLRATLISVVSFGSFLLSAVVLLVLKAAEQPPSSSGVWAVLGLLMTLSTVLAWAYAGRQQREPAAQGAE